MPHLRTTGRHRKPATIGLVALLGVAGATVTAIALSSPASNAATESCTGLDTALQNNLGFIASQHAAPDAQSAARITNRMAVVDQIQQRRQNAGCQAKVAANHAAVDCAAVAGAADGSVMADQRGMAGRAGAADQNGMAQQGAVSQDGTQNGATPKKGTAASRRMTARSRSWARTTKRARSPRRWRRADSEQAWHPLVTGPRAVLSVPVPCSASKYFLAKSAAAGDRSVSHNSIASSSVDWVTKSSAPGWRACLAAPSPTTRSSELALPLVHFALTRREPGSRYGPRCRTRPPTLVDGRRTGPGSLNRPDHRACEPTEIASP